MMNKWIVLLFAALLGLAACKNTKDTTKEELGDRLDKTLLWKITGEGIEKPSYLFGTIHVIEKKHFVFSEPAKEALEETDKLVLEMDMSNPMAMGMKMLQLAPMKDKTKLRDLLPDKEYSMVKKYFEEEAVNPEIKMMPFQMIENWKPMLLQSFLYTDMIDGETESYEMYLIGKAKKREMGIGGLETIEDQMNVFETISYEDQAEMLVKSVRDIRKNKGQEEIATEMEKLVKMYKAEDPDGMVEMTIGEMSSMEKAEEALLKDRNHKWIPKIIETAKEEPTFFAVGAAHLGGKDGVIRLLRKEGYSVEPIMQK